MIRPVVFYGALATVLALAGASFAAPGPGPAKMLDAWVDKAEKRPAEAPVPVEAPKPTTAQPVEATDCYDEARGGFAPCVLGPETAVRKPPGVAILEAEGRVADAGACGSDGDAMRPLKQHDASGGAILEFPAAGCWAVWKAYFETPVKRLVVGSIMPAGAAPNCVVWDLYLDGDRDAAGAYLGSTTAHCSKKEHKTATLEVLNGGAPIHIPPGTHALYAYARIVRAPGFEPTADHVHAYLDFLVTGSKASKDPPGPGPEPVKPQPAEKKKAASKPEPAAPES